MTLVQQIRSLRKYISSEARHRERANVHVGRLSHQCDATHLERFYAGRFTTIDAPTSSITWFQCPWSDDRTRRTAELLRRFIDCALNIQEEGDLVLIGITEHSRYFDEYLWESFVADSQRVGFAYLGNTKSLIGSLLFAGYTHTGASNIHDLIIEDHTTAVFRYVGIQARQRAPS